MSRLWLRIACALAIGTCIGLSSARAEQRAALVIGNSSYQTVPALTNPTNDARAVTEFLTSAGFEVTTVRDLGQTEMRRAIAQFADSLSGKGPDTVALVFYAGHGVQIDGENYLVPVDASIVREADVPLQAVRLADLMNALAAVPAKSRIVMLDACRNNPFSEINKVTGKGLAIVDAPPGTIVSYATSPGSEAMDGEGDHSPYTTAFLAHTKEPGLPIEQAFKRMRFAVNDATNRQQLPWESSSLTSDFSFFGGASFALASAPSDSVPATRVSATPASAPLSTARGPGRSVDAWKRELQRRSPSEAYELVLREDTIEAYQAFLSLFPSQANGPRVRQVLDRRRVMIAWYTALITDTPSSYRVFLAAYADTDLAATARRLLERAQNRSIQASVGNTCPCALQPQPQQQQQRQPRQPEQRATRSLNKKQAKKEPPPKRTKRAPAEDDSPPPAPVQQAAPMPMMPIGIGIGGFGGGGFGGGGLGGGGGRSTGPSHSTGSYGGRRGY